MSLTSSTELTSSGEIPQTLQLSKKRRLKLRAERRRRKKSLKFNAIAVWMPVVSASTCLCQDHFPQSWREEGAEGKNDASSLRELSALARHSSAFLRVSVTLTWGENRVWKRVRCLWKTQLLAFSFPTKCGLV